MVAIRTVLVVTIHIMWMITIPTVWSVTIYLLLVLIKASQSLFI